MCADFQEEIFMEISEKKTSKLFVVLFTMKNLELFPRNLLEDFFLKIGILSLKVYTKNVLNIEA